jgi:hypothetical protein
MHRTAVNANTLRQRTLMGVQARKRGQQRWMNIHQTPLVVTNETFSQDTHEASQHHKIRRKLIDTFGERSIEGFTTGKALVINEMGDDSRFGCRFEALGLRPVADHGGDIDRQAAGIAGGNQGFHVAAPAGNKDDDIFHLFEETDR